jgi:hypothetical protein
MKRCPEIPEDEQRNEREKTEHGFMKITIRGQSLVPRVDVRAALQQQAAGFKFAIARRMM